MRHIVLDEWSRRDSALHRRDPRAKIAAMMVFVAAIATTRHNFALLGPLYLGLAAAGFLWGRIPLGSALARAGAVLPFSAVFAGAAALAGDPHRGALLAARSYLSGCAVLLLVATTPLPALLRGFERLGAPPFLLTVAQFLYRYLFVISEEARHMRMAAASRGARGGARRLRFRAAAGALAVLFARSHARASDIHRAMLARGFTGRFRLLEEPRFRPADALFLLPAAVLPLAVRLVWGGGA